MAERAVLQYLMLHLGGVRLNEAVLFALGSPGGRVVLPLPRAWREAIASQGIPVASHRARIAWAAVVVASLGHGVLRVLRSLRDASLRRPRPDSEVGQGVAHFEGLTSACIPSGRSKDDGFNILTWYAHWQGRGPAVRCLTHCVDVPDGEVDGLAIAPVASPLPRLSGPRAIVRYGGWALGAILVSLWSLVRGRWWEAVMLAEAADAARLRVAGPAASEYLFHNSAWLYRPLWTYAAEAAGARILFYFYSANVETFKRPSGYPTQANTWNLVTWPHYLVWDEWQAQFLRRHVDGDPIIDIVGPIWFQAGPVDPPPVPAGAVAVFDVQPVRDSARQLLTAERVYYQPDVARRFFDDVYEVLRAERRPMVLKRKRVTSERFLHGTYRALMREIETRSDVLFVDPRAPSWLVLERCELAVSMPFTSTAVVARSLGRPAVFYVPDGTSGDWIQTDDRAAHGIPVIRGRDALAAWVRDLTACSGTQAQ